VREARLAGDSWTVERLCREAAETELVRGELKEASGNLTCVGGARLMRFEFENALAAYLEAKKVAEQSGDRVALGLALLNLSNLYQQVWDSASALRAAEQGVEVTRAIPDVFYEPTLLLQLGRLLPAEEGFMAEKYLAQGIEASRNLSKQFPNLSDATVEALGLDLLGERLRNRGDFKGAEEALQQAYQLRKAKYPLEVGFSESRLGALRLAESEGSPQKARLLKEAESYTNRALDLQSLPRHLSFPRFVLLDQRGKIRKALGNPSAALADFAAAVELAQGALKHFLPATSTMDAANAGIEESVLRSFVEEAAEQSILGKDPGLARKSFLAEEGIRAASLRQGIEMAEVWRRKLPPQYFQTLAHLRAEESRQLSSGAEPSPAARRSELELTEMEERAGLDFSQKNFEIFAQKLSLKHILEGLRDTEVLLSFHLGERQSFLWAVTRTTLRLYPVAPRERIRRSVKEFRDAVESGKPDAERLGRQLYLDLFGQLGEERKKQNWLLSLEDVLFELPFSALLVEPLQKSEQRSHGNVYLVEQHSLQVIPGAFLLRQEPSRSTTGRMVAVGDPIYNTADPRWHTAGTGTFSLDPFRLVAARSTATSDSVGAQMNRLVGSSRETESVARAWGDGSTVLEGPSARRQPFLDAIKSDASRPAPQVIHLSTHALVGAFPRRKSFVTFGLGEDARPELLSQADIGMLSVPGSLVVMTGCSTAKGDILSGAGLQGLTEAWAVAGASGVVATEWPVRDLAGDDFLPGFYRSLRSSSAAEALRKAQIAMIHSRTVYAEPSFWASYQLFGGAR
jgi:CHAT domain-containing protein